MSDTPDFDSMSPEEVMAWMESLAKRQGADASGFTTSADLEVPEVDPDTVDMESLGEYIPHGWTKERWEEQKAKDEAEKQARLAATQSAPPAPAPKPTPPAPVAETPPKPAAAPAADSTPDFDSMSPEEMMAWMESLAKRQGADASGFTTSANLDVPEVDPETVDIASLGEYIPHGWTEERWAEQKAKEAAEKAARMAQQTPPAKPAEPEISEEEEPEPTLELPQLFTEEEETVASTPFEAETPDDSMSWLQDLAGEASADLPDFTGFDADDSLAAVSELAGEDESDPLSWLGSLAAEEEEISFDGLELDTPEEISFESLGLGDVDESVPSATAQGIPSPIGTEDDPVEWLESLAKRQGADSEELATQANLDIPQPEGVGDEGPGYTEYSFIEPVEEAVGGGDDDIDPFADFEADLDDPEDWLDALASGQSKDRVIEVPKEVNFFATDDDDVADLEDIIELEDEFKGTAQSIQEKARTGTLEPDDVKSFFESAFEKAEQFGDDEVIDEEDEEEFDPDAPAVPTELPDWLLDQMQAQEPEPPAPVVEEEETSALLDAISEPQAVDADMPDWLTEGIEEDAAEDISSIFAADVPVDEAPAAPAVVEEADTSEEAEVFIDEKDSWVQAFEEESRLAPDEVPEWYAQALETQGFADGTVIDAEDIEEVEEPAPAAAATTPAPAATFEVPDVAIHEADLPDETDVPEGIEEDIPSWFADMEEPPQMDFDEMPDWLIDASEPVAEVDEPEPVAEADEPMPDWLSGEALAEPTEELPDWLSDTSVTADEVPDWLKETMPEEDQAAIFVESTPAPTPAPAPVPAAPAAPASPAPVVPSVADIDVAATLKSAREKIGANDIDSALADFELVVRANTELQTVESELGKLVEAKKKNPAIYRVLGDVLMRQGKLQAALETYRRALNML